LSEQFTGSSLNVSNWSQTTPFSDSSVTVSGGSVSVANGGGIISTTGFASPIEVTFRFAFTGSAYDSFRLATRVDNFFPAGYSIPHGIAVSFRLQEDTGNLANNITIEQNGSTLVTGTYALSANTFYTVRLVDNGNSMSLFWGSDATAFITGATSSTFGNKIAIYNREGAGNGSSISAGSITSVDFITVSAIPEPSTYAALAGLAALAGAIFMRRRRQGVSVKV